jgi:hypothetical protein
MASKPFKDADRDAQTAFMAEANSLYHLDALSKRWSCVVCSSHFANEDVLVLDTAEPGCPVMDCSASGWDIIYPDPHPLGPHLIRAVRVPHTAERYSEAWRYRSGVGATGRAVSSATRRGRFRRSLTLTSPRAAISSRPDRKGRSYGGTGRLVSRHDTGRPSGSAAVLGWRILDGLHPVAAA